MKYIDGGVCAAKGFKAAGIGCGIRKKGKKDLALIISEKKAAAAGVYTQNLVQGAPIIVTKQNIEDGFAQAIIANSGNANTCNSNGIKIAQEMCQLVHKKTGIPAGDIAVASTGVIGQELSLNPIMSGMDNLISSLGSNSSDAATAIMTTDTARKEISVEFTLGDTTVHIGGIAKGSGMIHPNMATMLCFLTTDVAISPSMLKLALNRAVESSFNMISVDRDTSTNDTALILANGMAGNPEISQEDNEFEAFVAALSAVCLNLARSIARDGEGATKLIISKVTGAKTKADAVLIAKSVICSPLLKCAMFGSDANWGRVLCALGYAGAKADIWGVNVSFQSTKGRVDVCENGVGIDFSEEIAKTVLSEDEVTILIGLKDGDGKATAYGCDLSYNYVKINGDYRS